MGMTGGGSGGMQSEINVTPMVDIMLVLLIIFMVVTPLLQHGITVALPQNTNNPDEDPRIIKESSVVISIPNNGEYYLGKVRVAQDEIKTKVGPMLEKMKSDDDRIVYIKSGVNVSYGDVVNVINEVRGLGVDKIGLVADKKKGGAVAPPPLLVSSASRQWCELGHHFAGLADDYYTSSVAYAPASKVQI